MRPRPRNPARRLRTAVERLPRHTKEAMLRGIDSNRIVVGAYVDPRSGGICPMLAAHRNGGRTSVASFARAWDEYTGARRPRRATRREVRTLRALLEESLGGDWELEHTPISELAAQIRAEREELARCRVPEGVTLFEDPVGERRATRELEAAERADRPIRIRRRPSRDILAAADAELSEG